MTERLVELLLRAGLIKRFVSLHGAEKDLLSFAIFLHPQAPLQRGNIQGEKQIVSKLEPGDKN